MSERTDITEQDVDYVLAVLRARYPGDKYEPPRDRLRQALVDGWWSIEEYRAVAAVALATAQEEARRFRQELQNIASADWREWDSPYNTPDEFVVWAKSRANHALARGEAGDNGTC